MCQLNFSLSNTHFYTTHAVKIIHKLIETAIPHTMHKELHYLKGMTKFNAIFTL